MAIKEKDEQDLKSTYSRGSDPGEHDGEEEESIENAKYNDKQIHAEVVQAEQSRWREGKDHDAEKFR